MWNDSFLSATRIWSDRLCWSRGCAGSALLILLFFSGCTAETTVSVPTPLPAERDKVLYDVAGHQGVSGNDGDDGPAIECTLFWPSDITITPTGEILVVDWNNNRIRRIGTDGIIHHYIGSGQIGDGRTGDASQARFNHPTEIKVGPDGTYWISAFFNWCIKNVDPVTLNIIQVLGDTVRGYRGDYPQNGGSLDADAKPRFDLPSSLVFDPAGNLYFCDQGNTRIRKIDLQTRVISTFVGGTRGDLDGVGEAAQFSFPGCSCFWPDPVRLEISPTGEDIYVADAENHRIRKINIATRMVTTIAGTGEPGYSGHGRPALTAQLNYPQDLAVSISGDLYIADSHNHVIRKIDSSGTITTVAGNGVAGSSPNGTPAVLASLYSPTGIAFDDATHTLYIADTYNQQIKKVINP